MTIPLGKILGNALFSQKLQFNKLLKMCGQHSFEILSHCVFTRLFSRGGMGLEEIQTFLIK